MSLKAAFTIITLIFAARSFAEYRVYQYIVTSKYPISADDSAYTVTSTLDPVSYVSYHGGRESLKVDLLNTWLCKGHTGGRKPCSSPLKEMEDKEPLQNQ